MATVGADNVPNGPMPRREQAIQIIEAVVERSINRRIHEAKVSGEYDRDALDLLRLKVPDDIETMLVELLEHWEKSHATPATVEVTEVTQVTGTLPDTAN